MKIRTVGSWTGIACTPAFCGDSQSGRRRLEISWRAGSISRPGAAFVSSVGDIPGEWRYGGDSDHMETAGVANAAEHGFHGRFPTDVSHAGPGGFAG